jgi:hypothetical protein
MNRRSLFGMVGMAGVAVVAPVVAIPVVILTAPRDPLRTVEPRCLVGRDDWDALVDRVNELSELR